MVKGEGERAKGRCDFCLFLFNFLTIFSSETYRYKAGKSHAHTQLKIHQLDTDTRAIDTDTAREFYCVLSPRNCSLGNLRCLARRVPMDTLRFARFDNVAVAVSLYLCICVYLCIFVSVYLLNAMSIFI